jgi:hypothetical protein
VLSESSAGSPQPAAGGKAFWWRLTDNLFRRLGWFLVPVILMTAFGFVQANNTLELFHSSGTLRTLSNPLVPDAQINGVAADYWETPADAMANSINEQLSIDGFLTAIAQRADLKSQIDNGVLDPEVIRASIWASADGESILSVHAQWDDPAVSHALATATIAEFQNFLTETAASQSTNAEAHYRAQLTRLESEHDEAKAALGEYVDSLGLSSNDLPYDAEVQLNELSDEVTALRTKIAAVETSLDEATLARTQESSEATRSIRVVDQPEVPTAPESNVVQRISLVISFMLLGIVIASAALLVTTVLDHSVSSTADLLTIGGISLVATVPTVRIGDRDHRRLGGRGPRRRRGTPATTGAV